MRERNEINLIKNWNTQKNIYLKKNWEIIINFLEI